MCPSVRETGSAFPQPIEESPGKMTEILGEITLKDTEK